MLNYSGTRYQAIQWRHLGSVRVWRVAGYVHRHIHGEAALVGAESSFGGTT